MLPTDLVYDRIPRGQLDTPLTTGVPPNDPNVESFVIDEIVTLLEKAGPDVVVLVDACAIRYHLQDELLEFLQRTGFPVYSAPMGKSAVPENYERYGGVRSRF